MQAPVFKVRGWANKLAGYMEYHSLVEGCTYDMRNVGGV